MHPLRQTLHNELHARPSTYFNAPAHVFHLAFLDQDDAARHIVNGFCDEYGIDAGPEVQQGEFAIGNALLKWELHTEFLTLTLMAPLEDGPLWPALPPALAAIAQKHAALLINANHIRVESESSWKGGVDDYGFVDPLGSNLDQSRASVWSDLRVDRHGLCRMLVLNRHLDGRRLGRMMRRLLEIETYRLMASLTLPVARALSAELRDYECELVEISEANNASETQDTKALLDRITRLSARVTQSSAQSRLRFSATQAYAELVFERIAELSESRTGDCQQLGIFIARRFRPTVRYCSSTDQRLTRIDKTAAHLGSLLQARVQVEMEEQNGQILQALNARADTQIRIQRAVEGLSIIAISYYLISLLKLVYEGGLTLGLTMSPRIALLVGAPLAALVLGVVYRRIRHARRPE